MSFAMLYGMSSFFTCIPNFNDYLFRIIFYNVVIHLEASWFGSWLLILDFCVRQKDKNTIHMCFSKHAGVNYRRMTDRLVCHTSGTFAFNILYHSLCIRSKIIMKEL